MGESKRKYDEEFKRNAVELCHTSGKTTSQIAQALGGLGASLGLGAVGLLLAAVVGGTSLGNGVWAFVPWAWPVRIMVAAELQLLEKLPPGAAHFRADAYALFILAMGLGLGLLLAVTGIIWFSCREAHA